MVIVRNLTTALAALKTSNVQGKPPPEAQIHNLLYEALEFIDAPLDLLQIVGSWRDTQPDAETLAQLEAFIARQREE